MLENKFLLCLMVAISLILSKSKFLQSLFPQRLLKKLPLGWTDEMYWTVLKSGGRRVYVDIPCQLKQPQTYKPKTDVEDVYKLSEADIQFFYENGYLGPFTLMSTTEAESLWKNLQQRLGTESSVYPYSQGAYVIEAQEQASSKDGVKSNYEISRYVMNYRDRHLEDDTLLSLFKHPSLTERCAQLLGSDLLLWRTQFFPKPSGKAGTPLHQASCYLLDNMKAPELQKNYNYDDNREYNWLYPQFSLLYGSRLYESASESQKKALNHLYWICFYNYSIGGEIATMMFNQLTCGAFYHLGGYETLCHELDLETSQERVHVEAFRQIVQLTELGLFGKTIFARPIPDYIDGAVVHPQKRYKRNFGRKLIVMFVGAGISRSPFLASQYYVLRGMRNNQLKVKEYQHSLYSRGQAKKGKFVSTPSLVSHYHCLDEAFHTSTSKLVSHEIYKDFAKPTSLELFLVNILVRNLQLTMNTLSCAVPGVFSDDAAYMPLVYEMLRSPLFNLSTQEALQMVEDSFCREHDGFHVAAKYHQRALKQNLGYLEGIDHLLGVNRELKVMSSASIAKSLQNNIKAFRRFRQTVLKGNSD